MKIVAFFNNKGGVGKTTLVYHIAHMLSRMGFSTLAIDMDPQANLTSAFLSDERIEELWGEDSNSQTILACVKPILSGLGDIKAPYLENISDNLRLINGDLGLSQFEGKLSDNWAKCFTEDEAAFRAITAFYRIINKAVEEREIDIVIMDVGPNLGAINRAALICANNLIIPLAADLFSLQGLRNLGPTIAKWREEWKDILKKNKMTGIPYPSGEMVPAGYVLIQHAERLDRPAKAFAKWANRIPSIYRKNVLKWKIATEVPAISEDVHCLETIRNYRSLVPMSLEARKPIFDLKSADGAIGSHATLVQKSYSSFERLAERIVETCKISK